MIASITISDLEKIIKTATEELKRNKGYIPCLDIECMKIQNRAHGDSDAFKISIQSGFAECNSKTIMFVNF